MKDYGRVTKDEKESFEHRFFVDGHEETLPFPPDGGKFELQNKLQEGYIYDITISGYTVTGAEMEEGDVAGVLTKVWTDDDGDWRIKVDNESFTINKDASSMTSPPRPAGPLFRTSSLMSSSRMRRPHRSRL